MRVRFIGALVGALVAAVALGAAGFYLVDRRDSQAELDDIDRRYTKTASALAANDLDGALNGVVDLSLTSSVAGDPHQPELSAHYHELHPKLTALFLEHEEALERASEKTSDGPRKLSFLAIRLLPCNEYLRIFPDGGPPGGVKHMSLERCK